MIATVAYDNHRHDASKRQKRSLSPPPLSSDPPPLLVSPNDDDCMSMDSLGGIEDQDGYDEEDEDESREELAREEMLLDRVLTMYEQYEEESLIQQSRYRSKLAPTRDSPSKARSSHNSRPNRNCVLKKKLHEEKVKCSLFKILTLLLQSNATLKGDCHQERVDLMRQVKHALQESESHSVHEIKNRFVMFFSSLRKDCFPPCSVTLPMCLEETETYDSSNTIPVSPCTTTFATDTPTTALTFDVMDQAQLTRETRAIMVRLSQVAKEAIQQRLLDGDWQQGKEEDWENMQQVWFVWLQFPAKSLEQRRVWQSMLQHCESLDSLLWNLAFYLSMME